MRSGNLLIVASTTSVVIALTWAGIEFPWSSAKVLVPLVLGFLGLAGFLVYEAWIPDPIVSEPRSEPRAMIQLNLPYVGSRIFAGKPDRIQRICPKLF
jgi:hypothetical protein